MKRHFGLYTAVIVIITVLCLFASCKYNNPDAIEVTYNTNNSNNPDNSSSPGNPDYTPIYPVLIINEWSDGSFTLQKREEWLEFIATAATQYIHFKKDTVTDVYVQLYNQNGAVDTQKNLYGSNSYASFSLTVGQVYYIKITPFSSSSTGNYKIGFTTSTASPDIITSANEAVQLNINEWSDSSFTLLDTEKWFKFTATAATQYIHFKIGTVTDVYVQLYNNSYIASDTQKNLYGSTLYTSSPVTVGQLYYIKVTPYGTQTGNFKIGVTGSVASPEVIAYMNTAVQLSINTWTSGGISSEVKEQWFKFTATAATQYIHFQTGTLNNVYVQLFNGNGVAVITQKNLYGSGSNLYTSSPVTVGQTYYIRVTPYSSSYTGNYNIGFTTNTTTPSS